MSWKMADKRTYVHWAEKKYDIIVFGMPTNFHYGNGMGTNPIQMMQALSAQVIRHKRMHERPVRVHRAPPSATATSTTSAGPTCGSCTTCSSTTT